MRTDSCLQELHGLLRVAGFDEVRPDLVPMWQAVQAWVATPVQDGVDDDLLFEASLSLEATRGPEPAPAFTLAFTRQFTFRDPAGAFAKSAHASVLVWFAVHEDFRGVTRMHDSGFGTADHALGTAGPGAAAWIRTVESSASLRAAMRHTLLGYQLTQGEA